MSLQSLVVNGQGKKTSILGLRVSAILHKYDAVLGRVWKKFPFTVTPLCCSESCLAEMQTWQPPVGVCHDCVVLLLLRLHWALGSAEWAEGQSTVREMTLGPAVTQAIQRERGEREKISWNSVLLVLRNTRHCHWQSVTFPYMWGWTSTCLASLWPLSVNGQ